MLFLNTWACCSLVCLHLCQGLCADHVSAVFSSLAIWGSTGEQVTVGVLTENFNNPHRRNLWGIYIFGHESRAFIWSFRVRHAVEHWLNGGTGGSRDQAVTFFRAWRLFAVITAQSLLTATSGKHREKGAAPPSVGGRINSFSNSSWSI